MRSLTLWLDDPVAGCGLRQLLEVERDEKKSVFLYVPTLDEVDVPTEEVDRQLKLHLGSEHTISEMGLRFFANRVEQFSHYGKDFAKGTVKTLIEAIRVDPDFSAYSHVFDSALKCLAPSPALALPDDPDDAPATTAAPASVTPIPAKKERRPAVPRPAKADVAALLAQATALGFVEQPAPNPGVRTMRIKNFLKGKGVAV